MSASYLAFRARMLSVNPLVDLAALIGQVKLDLFLRRSQSTRTHYETLAQEARR